MGEKMKLSTIALGITLALAACGGSAVAIDGLYQLSETVTASNCSNVPAGSTTTETLTVTTSGNTATESIASAQGTCPGQIDGNQVTWSCSISTSTGPGTLQISATFSGSGVSGTAVIGESCQVTLNFTGTKA